MACHVGPTLNTLDAPTACVRSTCRAGNATTTRAVMQAVAWEMDIGKPTRTWESLERRLAADPSAEILIGRSLSDHLLRTSPRMILRAGARHGPSPRSCGRGKRIASAWG
jgi:hypothetical protein